MYTDWSTVGGGRCFTPYYTPLRADARIRVVRIALDPLAADWVDKPPPAVIFVAAPVFRPAAASRCHS